MLLFKLGSLVATPAVLRVCMLKDVDPLTLINRRSSGDLGDLEQVDVEANVQAVQHDSRILSRYDMGETKLT